MSRRPIRAAVDIGGTFTDLVIEGGEWDAPIEAKSSTTPGDFTEGVLGTMAIAGVEPESIAHLVHGTTVVINAITQRSGVKTALVTTRGFRDSLEIGRGNRPDMYNLRFHKPEPFVPRGLRFEVSERVLRNGSIESPVDAQEVREIAARCRDEGVESIGICLLHSYAWPAHERAVRDILAGELPGVAISCSSDITREWREFERSSTVVLNAYVQPILQHYLEQFDARMGGQVDGNRRFVMLSNGGTASFASAAEQPIQLIESGPAGGVLGAALVGSRLGEPNVISFDVGGTTAKCSLIEDGRVNVTGTYRLEASQASQGYPALVPVVDIVEIGAGGGSIVWIDEGGGLRIGPVSAGAEPGPACYGRGGSSPTITDAMVLTGVLDPEYFLGGRLAIDPGLSIKAFEPIAARLGRTVEETATGVMQLFRETTIDALRLVSIRRGHDPRDFTLIGFGGGGPAHAAALAAELGCRSVVIPPFPGTFSAWGMLQSQPRVDLAVTRVSRLVDTPVDQLEEMFTGIETRAAEWLAVQRPGEAVVPEHRRSLDMRYHGQEHTVSVPLDVVMPGHDRLRELFHEMHQRAYSFRLEDSPVEVVNYRVTSLLELDGTAAPAIPFDGGAAEPRTRTRMLRITQGDPVEATVYQRAELGSGFSASGPALVEEPSATTVVMPGQSFEVSRFGDIVISTRAH